MLIDEQNRWRFNISFDLLVVWLFFDKVIICRLNFPLPARLKNQTSTFNGKQKVYQDQRNHESYNHRPNKGKQWTNIVTNFGRTIGFFGKLDHPPHLPNSISCDFCIFPKMKTAISEHRFSNIPDIQSHVARILKSKS